MFCSKCGTAVPAGLVICQKCGNSFVTSTPAPAYTVPSQAKPPIGAGMLTAMYICSALLPVIGIGCIIYAAVKKQAPHVLGLSVLTFLAFFFWAGFNSAL